MYEKLYRGDFGNTVPMWFEWSRWAVEAKNIQYWGVRSLTPGGPCFLNVAKQNVVARCEEIQQSGHSYNISPMIDRLVTVTLWANIWDSPTGLVVEGITYPPPTASWRELMPDPSKYKRWERSAARNLLRCHLNHNSLNDIDILLECYPDHVIELSATEQQFGTVPGRNAVIWEVRKY